VEHGARTFGRQSTRGTFAAVPCRKLSRFHPAARKFVGERAQRRLAVRSDGDEATTPPPSPPPDTG